MEVIAYDPGLRRREFFGSAVLTHNNVLKTRAVGFVEKGFRKVASS